MSGEGPCVRFDPLARAFGGRYTRLAVLNDEELESAYIKSHEFILENKEVLVEDYNWKETDVEDDKLFSLLPPEEGRLSGLRYTLPSSFSSFRNVADSQMWKTQFERGFDARLDSSEDLHISGPHPLSNIFYLLQCIAPGMLLLVPVDDDDHAEEIEHARALPYPSWVLTHADVLTTVLGSPSNYWGVLSASSHQERSCRELDLPLSFSDDGGDGWDEGDNFFYTDETEGYQSDPFQDYTACGSDCGYCGHCKY